MSWPGQLLGFQLARQLARRVHDDGATAAVLAGNDEVQSRTPAMHARLLLCTPRVETIL
jgi:hypothetical protein